nr:MAG TPA: hypothetical protein [Caudoviricetes sp.]
MKDKTQYEALMEELKKLANNFKDVATELGDILAKILPDVEIPDEEEDTWEMKCPYEHGDTHYCIQPNGAVFADCWEGIEADNRYFSQGNVFPTEEAAELEAKRRNLLTRFRAFRDECNDGWKPNWSSYDEKWEIDYTEEEVKALWTSFINSFSTFGYFKNKEDAERAIELFGDEIIELFVNSEV